VVSFCLYDFGNSAYSAIVSSTLFPAYFTQALVGNESGRGDLWYGRAMSLSMLFVALTSPVLGSVADRAGLGKRLWIAYTATCILAVILFTTLVPGALFPAFALLVLASVSMEGAVVFYNSYLPRIAPPTYQGRVSGWAFGTGYVGSIVAMGLAMPFARPEFRPQPVWLLVAAQFALFAAPAFLFLPAGPKPSMGVPAAARQGLRDFAVNLRALWKDRDARRFLLAYVFYEDGVNTTIVFSSVFAAHTLGYGPAELLLLFLLVQLSALVGAFAMARPTDTWGAKPVIQAALVLWCSVVVAAYFVGHDGFWPVAIVAGLGLGTIQSASRSLFASFVPPGHEAQCFGVYAMVGKSAAVIGPLVFGGMSAAFGGNQRPAILAVGLLFLIGALLLRTVRPPARAAGAAAALH
jgi:UMF1 family MFS transporter